MRSGADCDGEMRRVEAGVEAGVEAWSGKARQERRGLERNEG